VASYVRRLPHRDVPGQPLFVTFRLYGSLPKHRVFPKNNLTSGRAFAAMDRLLEHARSGPFYLRHPEIAKLVCEAIEAGQNRFQRYELHAYVVMPNHVHMLVTSQTRSVEWLRSLKGFTGKQATELLGLSEPFWQDESYHRSVRSSDEFQRILGYIEENPVRAGLANRAEIFPWCSAARISQERAVETATQS
jgi:REP element-mobilizing transposase RayT